MKYRSISLNDNQGRRYSLVKYNKWYQDYLIELNKMNKELTELVLKYSLIYDETSNIQSYMIFQGEYNCVGAIIIDAKDLEKLEVKVQLNEKYITSQQQIFDIIEQIITSLKLFFYDKKNIEINLLNDLDLSMIDCQNYHKEDGNLNIYKCFNEQNNLIPKLIEEVISAEKKLTDWRQSWWQDLENHELHYNFDRELVNAIDNGTVTYPELFSKFKTLIWRNIASKNATRFIAFSRTGDIAFSKTLKKDGSNYELSYNVMNEGFKLRVNGKDLIVDDNKYFTNIRTKQVNILQGKENKRKFITYVSPIIDNFSIAMDIWVNESNEIEKCNIDFRTHKGNGRINGIHILRLNSSSIDSCSLKFVSRKGNTDFKTDLFGVDEVSKFEVKITFEMINEIIGKVISIINKKEDFSKNQIIFNDFDILTQEKQIINFLKQLKEEIPLPILQERIDKIVSKNEQEKKMSYKIRKEQ